MLNIQRTAHHVDDTTLPSIQGQWCFIDGYWKENDSFFQNKVGIVL